MVKKILLVLLVLLIVIQFIRPDRIEATAQTTHDITAVHNIPADVQQILKSACYDCHSNNPVYPWYANIQPVGWWLQRHIDEAREHLNFSEFGKLSPEDKAHAFEEIAEEVEEKKMPLKSYTWMHKDARLTDQERQLLVNWAKSLQTPGHNHDEHAHNNVQH